MLPQVSLRNPRRLICINSFLLLVNILHSVDALLSLINLSAIHFSYWLIFCIQSRHYCTLSFRRLYIFFQLVSILHSVETLLYLLIQSTIHFFYWSIYCIQSKHNCTLFFSRPYIFPIGQYSTFSRDTTVPNYSVGYTFWLSVNILHSVEASLYLSIPSAMHFSYWSIFCIQSRHYCTLLFSRLYIFSIGQYSALIDPPLNLIIQTAKLFFLLDNILLSVETLLYLNI